LSISGTVQAVKTGSAPQPLGGVAVDVYRFSQDAFGEYQFLQLNVLPALTNAAGAFAFADLPVAVQVQTVIPGSPPYEPIEIVQPTSLPSLVFRISAQTGTDFVEIYDERTVVDADWLAAHPDRPQVPLSSSAPFEILVPDYVPVRVVPGKEFHFLRVGRAIRDEIGELGESRADYVDYQGKAGYLISSNVRTVNAQPSYFGGQVDAPFGGTLQIGGQFGAGYLATPLVDNLYYTASFWTYSGNPNLPFNAAHLGVETQIQHPLANKRHILPTPALPNGRWETLPLGPFQGKITAVEAPHSPTLIGDKVPVYKRPGLPNLATEYWPFWDLMITWPSSAAPNGLIILTLEAYERTGGSDTEPELKKLAMDSSVNAHLPLTIDNRPPVPVFLPYDPADPQERKFHTAYAHFLGVAESMGASTPMGVCNEMAVATGDVDGNESILVRYSVEDGAGSAHQHLHHYRLWAEYTPKAVPGARDTQGLALKQTFAGFQAISQQYAPTVPPILEVSDFRSAIVPAVADGWPPEPAGDTLENWQCPQYALEVGLGCSVRTVDGWARLFGARHASRHLIIRRI
jgi:hypothetical protein